MKKYNGTLIFEGQDAFGSVEVVDRPNIRTLHFGTATEQSSMYLAQPFSLEMLYLRNMAISMLFQPKAEKVTCLGLGGGALPKFIWKYYPGTSIEAVDISPVVIDIGYRYFHVPQDPRLHIHAEDALSFLEVAPKVKDDLLFIDLYIKWGISPVVSDPNFFAYCDDRLKPGGILIWNMWRSTAQDMLEASLRNLGAVFGRNLLILSNLESLNYVVMVFKEPIAPYTRKQIDQEAGRLKAVSGIDFVELLQHLNYFKGYGYLFQDWS